MDVEFYFVNLTLIIFDLYPSLIFGKIEEFEEFLKFG